MNLESNKAMFVLGLALVGSTLFGCATPAVGAPCLPEQVPETGFDKREAYVETSSVQCETRVCIVYHLDGDPRSTCKPSPAPPAGCKTGDPGCAPEKVCADNKSKCRDNPNSVDCKVFCTCRCDSGKTGFAECECPAGFSCQQVLEQGSDGVRGGYCVRSDTANASN